MFEVEKLIVTMPKKFMEVFLPVINIHCLRFPQKRHKGKVSHLDFHTQTAIFAYLGVN